MAPVHSVKIPTQQDPFLLLLALPSEKTIRGECQYVFETTPPLTEADRLRAFLAVCGPLMEKASKKLIELGEPIETDEDSSSATPHRVSIEFRITPQQIPKIQETKPL